MDPTEQTVVSQQTARMPIRYRINKETLTLKCSVSMHFTRLFKRKYEQSNNRHITYTIQQVVNGDACLQHITKCLN
jgi:hypothetical protein